MPGKFQGLLVVSPVTRVRSVGLFLVKLCFLEIKALWQFQLQVYTERERRKIYKEHFEAKRNLINPVSWDKRHWAIMGLKSKGGGEKHKSEKKKRERSVF